MLAELGVEAHTFAPSVGVGRGRQISEVEGTVAYIWSSRIARAT